MARRGNMASPNQRRGTAAIGQAILCLILAVAISVTVIKPAGAYHRDRSLQDGKSSAAGSSINCNETTDARLPHAPGNCNDETCCIFNTNRGLDDENANIGILPILIAVLSIETVAKIIPVAHNHTFHEGITVYKSNYAQPPPSI
jgi:hypothetical protein